jgi:hypothetical protein
MNCMKTKFVLPIAESGEYAIFSENLRKLHATEQLVSQLEDPGFGRLGCSEGRCPSDLYCTELFALLLEQSMLGKSSDAIGAKIVQHSLLIWVEFVEIVLQRTHPGTP